MSAGEIRGSGPELPDDAKGTLALFMAAGGSGVAPECFVHARADEISYGPAFRGRAGPQRLELGFRKLDPNAHHG